MLVLTFAPCVLTFAPYILTFGPGACGVSLFSTCANISLAQGGGCHQLQLVLVVLLHSTTSADSPLAHVVVCIIIIHYTVIIMVFYCFFFYVSNNVIRGRIRVTHTLLLERHPLGS